MRTMIGASEMGTEVKERQPRAALVRRGLPVSISVSSVNSWVLYSVRHSTRTQEVVP